MNIHHVVPRICDEAAGPSYTVPALCAALHDQGESVTLHTLQPDPNLKVPYEMQVYANARKLTRLGLSGAMRTGLAAAFRQGDIVHSHCLWMMPSLYAADAARRADCRLVVAPRGGLQPWYQRRSRLRKELLWHYGQRRAIKSADCLHAAAESELAAFRELGYRMPIAVMPNGVDLPNQFESLPTQSGRRRLLYLGRIHPGKGIDKLILAWAKLQNRFADWELHIVGPNERRHQASLETLIETCGADRVTISGPVYGEEKVEEYRQADLFVLPSFSESFSMVVAESLAHGTPVVCTKGAPWSGIETHDCGWWIDVGVDPLVACLSDALTGSADSLAEQGQRGRDWMQREFSWASVAEQTGQLYRWLQGGGAAPDFVDQSTSHSKVFAPLQKSEPASLKLKHPSLKSPSLNNQSTKVPISVLLPVKNEVKNLGRCLDHIADWADEIVIVDSQSTDGTTELGEKYGVDVVQFHYEGGWPKKRQWALDTYQWRNDWTLLLDADEMLSEDVKRDIEQAIEDPECDGYWMKFRVFFLGRMLRYGDTELRKLSLFRTGRGHYELRTDAQDKSMADMEIHEHVIVDGEVGTIASPVRHENFNSLNRYIEKHNEYSNWRANLYLQQADGELKPSLWGNQAQRRRWLVKKLLMMPGTSILWFAYSYFFKLGILDGRPGLIFATFRGIQIFHTKSKIYERQVTERTREVEANSVATDAPAKDAHRAA